MVVEANSFGGTSPKAKIEYWTRNAYILINYRPMFIKQGVNVS